LGADYDTCDKDFGRRGHIIDSGIGMVYFQMGVVAALYVFQFSTTTVQCVNQKFCGTGAF
jgi:hypothetical protein